jgi:hypothetical protein
LLSQLIWLFFVFFSFQRVNPCTLMWMIVKEARFWRFLLFTALLIGSLFLSSSFASIRFSDPILFLPSQ